MKSALTIAAIAFALAQTAHAQVTCSELSRIAAHAEDDFHAIAGDEIDDDLYESSFAHPDAYGLAYFW